MTAPEPRTEAGRRFLRLAWPSEKLAWRRSILAIEAESASQPEPAVTEALRRLRDRHWPVEAQAIDEEGVGDPATLCGAHHWPTGWPCAEVIAIDRELAALAAVPAPSPAPPTEPKYDRSGLFDPNGRPAMNYYAHGQLLHMACDESCIEAEARAASPSPAVAPLDESALDLAIRNAYDAYGAAGVIREYARLTHRAYAEASDQAASPGEGIGKPRHSGPPYNDEGIPM